LLFSCANRRFKFHQRGQQFIGAHNEPLPVVVVRINNPDDSPGWNLSLRRSPNSNRAF